MMQSLYSEPPHSQFPLWTWVETEQEMSANKKADKKDVPFY